MKKEIKKEEVKQSENKLYTFKLDGNALPKFEERSGKDFIFYGRDNLYPNYLIELANSSALHGAILRSIVEQVKGQKIKIKDDVEEQKLQKFIDSCNINGESLFEVVSKIILDFIIFGGFSSSMIWNRGKTFFDLYHIDFSTIRSGKVDAEGNVSNYYFSSDWSKANIKNITEIPSFNSDEKTGNQIFYYKPYTPGNLYYPLPSYINVINWAEIDAKISEYHNANLDQGFFPSMFINFNNGIPDPSRADQIYNDLLDQFEGKSKAGRVIINYSNSKDQSPDIEVLNQNDSDSKFTELSNLILTQLLSGWRIVSSELVGINQPGRMGNSNIIEAQELFFNTVIKPKQQIIEKQINYILKENGFINEIEIVSSQPISFSVTEPTMLQVCTKNEIRELIGKEKIDGWDAPTNNSTADLQGQDLAPNNLRTTVGGIQSILAIQSSVSQKLTSYDSAIGMLTIIYGFTDEEARKILGNPQPQPEVQPQTTTLN